MHYLHLELFNRKSSIKLNNASIEWHNIENDILYHEIKSVSFVSFRKILDLVSLSSNIYFSSKGSEIKMI